MLIKPDAQQQGIEVRFDKVELNPNLKDTDYKTPRQGAGGTRKLRVSASQYGVKKH